MIEAGLKAGDVIVEVDDKKVSFRRSGNEETITLSLDEFINLLNEDIKNKTRYDK